MCVGISLAFIDKSGHFLNVSWPFKKGTSPYLKIPFSIQPCNKDEIGNSNTSISCSVPIAPHNTGLPYHQKWGKSLSSYITVSSVNTEAREVFSSSQLPAGTCARTEASPGQIYLGDHLTQESSSLRSLRLYALYILWYLIVTITAEFYSSSYSWILGGSSHVFIYCNNKSENSISRTRKLLPTGQWGFHPQRSSWLHNKMNKTLLTAIWLYIKPVFQPRQQDQNK